LDFISNESSGVKDWVSDNLPARAQADGLIRAAARCYFDVQKWLPAKHAKQAKEEQANVPEEILSQEVGWGDSGSACLWRRFAGRTALLRIHRTSALLASLR